jgi:hypothetical protein
VPVAVADNAHPSTYKTKRNFFHQPKWIEMGIEIATYNPELRYNEKYRKVPINGVVL